MDKHFLECAWIRWESKWLFSRNRNDYPAYFHRVLDYLSWPLASLWMRFGVPKRGHVAHAIWIRPGEGCPYKLNLFVLMEPGSQREKPQSKIVIRMCSYLYLQLDSKWQRNGRSHVDCLVFSRSYVVIINLFQPLFHWPNFDKMIKGEY